MKITINALADLHEPAPSSEPVANRNKWLLKRVGAGEFAPPGLLAPPPLADFNDWKDPRVGWGLVIPARPGFTHAQLAQGQDIENDLALQALLAYRRSVQGTVPVFHYGADPTPGHNMRYLRDYAAGMDVELTSGIGLGEGRLPFYLLIHASPAEIPWSFQAILQVRHAVGRIGPGMKGKENYFRRLMEGWSNAGAKQEASVVWTVAHDEMTHLMRNTFALPLHERLKSDPQTGKSARLLDGGVDEADGTLDKLIAVLKAENPAMIVTSSHGRTGPLDDVPLMTATLGLPVDQFRRMMDPATLTAGWQPDGTVWVAQACCSAGSDQPSQYQDLFSKESDVGKVLWGVAECGSRIAPLPELLLGHESPARGFFGHVEPTFNLTLQSPKTGQLLTDNLLDAFYNRLYQPSPLGRVLNQYHLGASVLHREWMELRQMHDSGQNVSESLLYTRTTAIDIDSFVFIGDPTAMLTGNS